VSPWLWAAAALVIGLAELHAPGYYLIWVACGAGVTALGGLVAGLPLEGQLILFAVATLASCVGGFFVYRRTMAGLAPDEPGLNRGDRGLIGARGIVTEALSNGQGKIRLGDSVWLAQGPDLPAGTPIVVTEVHGTIAVVAAA
jgi:membrane protein implicated in regulation of membrane protease activity